MKNLNPMIITLMLTGFLSQNAIALSSQDDIQNNSWQMNLIYQPSAAMLEREKQGFVMIYDGLTDFEVNTIMDDKFKRIQNMMFTRVKLTSSKGKVLKDPLTGAELVEEDGCDD